MNDRDSSRTCRYRTGSLSTLGVALLAACATVPQPSVLDPDTSARQFQERRLVDATLLAKADAVTPCAPDCTWNLDRLTLVAWSNDPGLAEARAALARAEAEANLAQLRPNPNLNLGSEYNRDARSGNSPWLLSAALEFTFETAGKRQLRVEGARAAISEQLWAYAAQAGDVRQRLRQARLDLNRREQEAALTARLAAAHQKRSEFLRRRVEQGALARPEGYQAERDAVSAAADKLHSDAGLKQARAALAAALAVPVTALDAVTLPELPLFEQDAESLTLQHVQVLGVDNRPDLARALDSYRRADTALRLEVAKRTPDIVIGPGLLFDEGDHKFSLGTNLIAPIFDQNQHGIAMALAARDEAAAHFVKLQTEAFGDIETARTRLVAATENYRVLNARRERDREAGRQLQARLQAGAIDRLELLDAELLALQAERLRIDALTEIYTAFAQMERAVGRPVWPPSSLIPPSGPDADEERTIE